MRRIQSDNVDAILREISRPIPARPRTPAPALDTVTVTTASASDVTVQPAASVQSSRPSTWQCLCGGVFASARALKWAVLVLATMYLLIGCELGLPWACTARNVLIGAAIVWLCSTLWGIGSRLTDLAQQLWKAATDKTRTEQPSQAARAEQTCMSRADLCQDEPAIDVKALEPTLVQALQSELVMSAVKAIVGQQVVHFVKTINQDRKEDTVMDQARLASLEATIQDHSRQLASLRSESVSLGEQFRQVRRTDEKTSASLEGRLKQHQDAMSALGSKVAGFQDTVSALRTEQGRRLAVFDQTQSAHAASISLLWHHMYLIVVCALVCLLLVHVILSVFSAGHAPFTRLRSVLHVCLSKPLGAVRMYWTSLVPWAIALGFAGWHAGVCATMWIGLAMLGARVAYEFVSARELAKPAESRALDALYVRRDDFMPWKSSVDNKIKELELCKPSHRLVVKQGSGACAGKGSHAKIAAEMKPRKDPSPASKPLAELSS